MPPKSVRVRTLTRSQTQEQGLEFTWSRQLGGSVELSSRELDVEETETSADSPEGSAADQVSVEVEVEVSESDDDNRSEAAGGSGEQQEQEESAQLVLKSKTVAPTSPIDLGLSL